MKRKPPGFDLFRPYQKSALDEFFEYDKKGYWVGTGLGKTALALASIYIKNLGWPVLILTRAIGRHAWPRDAKWVLGPDFIPAILRQGSKRTVEGIFQDGSFSDLDLALSEHLMVVTNYDVLQMRIQELVKVPWRGLILDEVHSIKGGMNTIKLKRGGVPKFTRYHYTKMLACQVRERGGCIIQLSATPIKDRTRDLWAQLDLATLDKFLDTEQVARRHEKAAKVFWFSREKAVPPGPFGTFWKFAMRYCNAHEGQYGWVTDGSSNLEELERRLTPLYVQRGKEEVMDELPTLSRDVTMIDVKLPNYDFTKSKIENAFARSAYSKFDTAVEIASDYLRENQKLVITVNLRKLANRLTIELQKKLKREFKSVWVECITGSIPTHKRAEILDKFNTYPKAACFVATMECFSESIDLHHVDSAIVLSLPYTPGLLSQFEGRFHRLKGTPTTIHYLVANGSVDDFVKESLLDKLETVVSLNAGTGGEDKSLLDLKNLRSKEEVQADLLDWLNNKG
jgi:superfamily II DNA or RNA helicase